MAWSAARWKAFYAAERQRLGDAAIAACLDVAPRVALPPGGALIFPHTRLEISGHLTAAVALALVRERVDAVLAVGVLHGAREADAERVAAARAGDAAALAGLRGVHDERGYAAEEFSLDAFRVLLAAAARRENAKPPRVVARYPFLVGAAPESLPGLGELRELVQTGAVVVATADPVHHGAGYDTPAPARLPRSDATRETARGWIATGLELLAQRELEAFAAECARVRSDFRDAGPVIATLCSGALTARVHALELVDYAGVLGAPQPTWVAAALSEIAREAA